MKRARLWMVLALGSAPLLTACNADVPPPGERTVSQAVTTYQARDYFFPASGTARAVYSFTETTNLPAQQAGQGGPVSGTVTVEVTDYSPNQATLRITTTAPDESGQPSTDTSTRTVTVTADGTVLSQDEGITSRRSDAVLTPGGAEILPASGSIPAMRGALLGTEPITVPAGTYDTVRIQESLDGLDTATLWLAPGVGLVRMTRSSTLQAPPGSNLPQNATSTLEISLQSYTP